MKTTFLMRLGFDVVAACLLLVALAYYWLGNLSHEWIGTCFFLLIALHNMFNWHWYGVLPKKRRTASGKFDMVMTLALLMAMLVLMVTSVVVSLTVFSFLQIKDNYTVRQIHAFSAYWAMIFVAIHIGIRWTRVMNAIRSALHLSAESSTRKLVLRLIAGAFALYGLQSAVALDISSKLTLQVSIDWWDFEASTAGFFLGWVSIVGLFACVSHYGFTGIQQLNRYRKAALTSRVTNP